MTGKESTAMMTMATETGGVEIEGLISLDKVAEILAVSRRTVKSLVHEGELRSVKVRRRRLVRPQDLRAYMSSLDT